MTNEELEKEARDYADNQIGCGDGYYEWTDIENAYLAGAKFGLKQHSYDYLVKTNNLKKKYEKQIADLEKENATLKKQLEALSGDIPWNELKDVSEVTKKLTEVKEILQVVLDKWEQERWILQSDAEIKQIENLMKQAENFLKENI